ncbi:DUF4174 domain-containing protein [Photobacterium sp. OFAV2-7]|uniref:DUF4174 domain-containing protein n=1 Tax=Photobacterium sp. OFAV2-7 TaxID=2917748 RepID=UPI001EF5A6A2|nr:DUF4174 domain-containing protein [Photobacterium sp. OFAV2-7]MCG7587036.1 DUF4174 domain-containing protein [Photobacterium sp. OFAV2-7]
MKALISYLYSAVILFSSSVASYPLDSLHWNHRSILFFAPEKDQYVQEFMKQTLMNGCLLQERDIVTIIITRDGFNQPENLFSPEDIRFLQQKYNITQDSHTAILIGKDGLEKHRWGEETNWRQITDLVDKMPLRQREMTYRQSRCAI